jgi:SpoVK/Ycf46/Vps4 family AAA+-type ATPase
MTGSDIESICRRASIEAIREFLDAGLMEDETARLTIAMSHFHQAIEEVKLLHADSPAYQG